MESDNEGQFPLDHEAQSETSVEVEDIYKEIEALSNDRKAQLFRKVIKTLTTDGIANFLDEIAVRLREIQ